MKKISGKRRKHTNKRKQHDSQPASLPPTSHSSQPDVGPLKANSLPPPVPPQSTSLPSVAPTQQHSQPLAITPMSTSLPPSFPPLSTSLPSSFFSVPPCGPIQNNSTASHGRSTSLPNNIVPTPRINCSSSCHISQKGSSSSLLPSSTQAVSVVSSTPSISRSNIGGPVPASPSVISSSTTTLACAKTQYAGAARLYTPMEEDKSTNTIEPQKGAQQNPLHWPKQAWTHFELVRQKSPLIQCITNFVSMDLMANTLLSAGASPAMIHSVEEIPEFTPKALGVCINAGTLTPDWLPGMKLAAQVANQSKKPWVLDPVAAGGSSFRLKACLELLALKPSVVRGNGSEILALFKGCVDSNSKGADSVHGSSDAVDAAKSLAQQSGSVVAISGAVDYITDGDRVVCVHNGVPMLQKITASGCSVTALIAAFVAVDPSHAVEATASALAIFGVASEVGMDMARGPASLRTLLIDSLYGLDEATALGRVRINRL